MILESAINVTTCCDSCGQTIELVNSHVLVVCEGKDDGMLSRKRVCTSCRASSLVSFTPSKLHLADNNENAQRIWSADTESDCSTITLSTKAHSTNNQKDNLHLNLQRQVERVDLSTCLSEIDPNEVCEVEFDKENKPASNTTNSNDCGICGMKPSVKQRSRKCSWCSTRVCSTCSVINITINKDGTTVRERLCHNCEDSASLKESRIQRGLRAFTPSQLRDCSAKAGASLWSADTESDCGTITTVGTKVSNRTARSECQRKEQDGFSDNRCASCCYKPAFDSQLCVCGFCSKTHCRRCSTVSITIDSSGVTYRNRLCNTCSMSDALVQEMERSGHHLFTPTQLRIVSTNNCGGSALWSADSESDCPSSLYSSCANIPHSKSPKSHTVSPKPILKKPLSSSTPNTPRRSNRSDNSTQVRKSLPVNARCTPLYRMHVDHGSSAGVGGSCFRCSNEASQYLRIHKCDSCRSSYCSKCSNLQVKIVGDGTLCKERICYLCQKLSPENMQNASESRRQMRVSFSPFASASAAKKSRAIMSDLNLRSFEDSPTSSLIEEEKLIREDGHVTPYLCADEEKILSPALQQSLHGDLNIEAVETTEQSELRSPNIRIGGSSSPFSVKSRLIGTLSLIPFLLALLGFGWITGRQSSVPLFQVNISMDVSSTLEPLLLPTIDDVRVDDIATSAGSSFETAIQLDDLYIDADAPGQLIISTLPVDSTFHEVEINYPKLHKDTVTVFPSFLVKTFVRYISRTAWILQHHLRTLLKSLQGFFIQ